SGSAARAGVGQLGIDSAMTSASARRWQARTTPGARGTHDDMTGSWIEGRAWILLLRPNAVKTPSGSAGSAPRARDQRGHDEDGVHLPHAAARAAVAVGLRRIGDEAAAVLLAGERRAEGLAAIPSQRRLLALAGRVEAGAFGVVGDRLA